MNEELIIAIEELRKMPHNRTWFIPVVLHDSSVPDRAIGGGETLRDIQWVKLYDDWKNGIKQIIKTINPSSIVQNVVHNEPLVIMITDICDSRDLPRGATIQIKEIQYKEINKYGGRTNINMNDVCIAAFERITPAIRCASDIHKNLAKYLGDNSAGRLGVRIGIHFGKVSLSEENVIEMSGSEVSIACKLCREAKPGQTLISGSVKRIMDLSAFTVRQHLTVSKELFEETIEVYAVVTNADRPQPGASR